MPQLIHGSIIGLHLKEPLKICHGTSLTRSGRCCLIDQFEIGRMSG